MSSGATSSRLAVLLFTDIVGSTELKSSLGTPVYARLLARHNDLFESICGTIPGREIFKHTGDGYFAAFPTASDAVRFALTFQAQLSRQDWGPRALTTRIGIHIGEVAVVSMAGKSDVVGLAADLAARAMSLAMGGQILMTRVAFNEARQFVSEHPPLDGAAPPSLKWIAHGPYLFKGSDEPIDVFEVGAEGFAPLVAPQDAEKARRVVPHDQEPTLGWRPAVGQAVPKRPGWTLQRQLGEGGFGEVWLGQHHRTKDRRVFKFCFDVERLRSLKRELTLFRLLRDALGDRADIARLYEVQLDEPPFFLESEYTEGGNLAEWSGQHGGINQVPLPDRLTIVAQIADAVAAAHSIGILHKDVKPSNVLIHSSSDGVIQARLCDFGIGLLRDRKQLQQRNITAAGLTMVTEVESSRTGTPLYAPPELLAGYPFTIQGDVYALGVMLYQLVIGDLDHPLAQGWERDVPDQLLREDIAACVEGDPARRLSSAAELSQRLRTLEHRRSESQRRLEQASAQARRKRLTRLALASAAALVVLLGIGIVTSIFYIRAIRAEQAKTLEQKREAERQKEVAQTQADVAAAVNQFLRDMLAGAKPENTRGRQVSVRELLDQSAKGIEGRFDKQPLVEAAIRRTIADTYGLLGEPNAALPHAMRSLELCRLAAADDDQLGDSLVCLANSLRILGRNDEALALLKEALDESRAKHGDRNKRTAQLVGAYAVMLHELGRSQEALPLLKQSLELQRTLGGDDDPDTILALNSYAAVLMLVGRLEEAEPLLKQALEKYQQINGPDHPTTLQLMNNYASTLLELKRTTEAAPLFEQVLESNRRVLGNDHPLTINSLSNYAGCLSALNRRQEAEPIFREAWETHQRLYGDDHPQTILLLLNYATTLDELERSSEAEPMYRQVLSRARQSMGNDHHVTITCMRHLGTHLYRLKRFDETEPLFKEAAEGAEHAWGKTDQRTIKYARDYAICLSHLNQLQEAESILREAWETQQRVYGDEHPQTITMLHDHAALLHKLERKSEAEPMYRQALSRARKSIGDDHPDTIDCMRNLGRLLDTLKRSDEAEPLLKEAMERAEHVLGKTDPRTIKYALDYANCLENLRRKPEAERIRSQYVLPASTKPTTRPE